MSAEIRIRAMREAASVSILAWALFASAWANAAVTISSGTTQNMNCANGVCAPTAKDAVLNVGDLGNLLASGNVEVTTTGSGVQAKDIVVTAALSWSTSNALALDAHRSIAIDQPVSVAGQSALALTTNDGGKNGDLAFGKTGNVTFANLSSSLTIDGVAYMLVNSIQGLSSAIANNPSGDFALASSYNAQQDGTYTTNPVATKFSGTFEGLGNAISHFTMQSGLGVDGGLFRELDSGGVLRDVGLKSVKIRSKHGAAGLVPFSAGSILHCYVTGSVRATGDFGGAGGLVEDSVGIVGDSYAQATVTGAAGFVVGGLLGENFGSVYESFSTGSVILKEGGTNRAQAQIGGLIGENDLGTVVNSYATGAVTGNASGGGPRILVGGLIGVNDVPISQSYSTGFVTNEGAQNSYTGGLIGYDGSMSGSLTDTYWDIDTSGITNLSQGAGNMPDDPGITGLTTQQFQSGLPAGFDPSVWGENPKINNGLPYLLNNPPPK